MKNKLKFSLRVTTALFISFLLSVQIYAKEGPKESERKNPETMDLVEAPHAVLVELSTGKILFEKDAHVPSAPASVTKIMTMLLIFEALEEGKIKLEDMVTVSERAASMGGSQVFLEVNEKQTVDTMLKCIAIASANDACVAMAEHLAGTEENFVKLMNEKAKALGMKNTNFVNCNGLDTESHQMSAYDVALMSLELLRKHPEIHKYCTVWMEEIVHTTAKGNSTFGLSNTNKLLRQYEYCTGLKTGSTSNAGFCVSASAKKGNMELVAVIMNGETSKSRFSDAMTLLNYGFENFRIYEDSDDLREILPDIPVVLGVKDRVDIDYENSFVYLLEAEQNENNIEKRLEIEKKLEAPVKKGDVVGKLVYYEGSQPIGEVKIVAKETVEKADFTDCVMRVWLAWMM